MSTIGCTVKPQPIVYGSDVCHFCSMTIVDQQHAAQFVTDKGKAFKFDASECMMNHLKEVDNFKGALFLVNDYEAPGELIDATKATFLISKGIPSPMGEFLTAFGTKEGAEMAQSGNGGDLFTWEELKSRFSN
ncbi:nitrous oxide reductase accessory protein NosL [Maribacter halichondriae]|uniref:nitrous oxide reductase accessory protein NosL n=1 Tax=Maribacter halichondriae TaxID=2980554 RepID=UPI002359AEA6|nr:nitrous oxide reductase accessory protein NosL [Maribacter sp. Hal144]